MSVRVGVDTGGTFTDMVASEPGGAFRVAKTLSTPGAPARATRDALERIGLAEPGAVGALVHGTTIATNALLERKGAAVGLITTAGFGDVLELQRGGRPNSFDLDWIRSRHVVPRGFVREVAERVDARGGVRLALDEAGVRRALAELIEAGAEAIAVSFLFSFLNDAHERRVRELAAEAAPGLAVSLASEVFPQLREYERASTAVIDAYLKPPVDRYATELEQLATELRFDELLVMRSNGGAITPDGVRGLPVSMVRSGPAGGVIASVFVAEAAGVENVMLGDMGGTSFDVCLIAGGQPLLTTEAEMEWGLPICQPMVDVRSVGAGGGSIAWLDGAGLLHVGPQSAGSVPGPACYGRGGEQPTVTDANVVLGRLSPSQALAGDLSLDVAAAERAIGRLAEEMGRDLEDVALGILEIADNNMAQELRLISIDRGLDPRDFTMMAFGGAGPLHATSLARALGMRSVIVPIFPGAFSAFGALIADTRFDYLKTALGGTSDADALAAVFAAMEARAHADLAAQGRGDAEPEIERRLDLRYRGQAWELEVPIDAPVDAAAVADAERRYHAEHRKRFGWNLEDAEVEVVNYKLAATLPRERPELAPLEHGPAPRPVDHRDVVFGRGEARVRTPVYWRSDLPAEARITGPAIVAEAISTTLLPPGDVLRVDRLGNLLIDLTPGA